MTESKIEWHDLKEKPDDLPFDGDNVLVTALYSGTNQASVYGECYVEHKYDKIHWIDAISKYPMDYYFDILAWAYYPQPYEPATETSPKVEEVTNP